MSAKRRRVLSESDSSDLDNRSLTPRSHFQGSGQRHRRLLTTERPNASAVNANVNTNVNANASSSSAGVGLDDIWTAMCTLQRTVSSLACKVSDMDSKIETMRGAVMSLIEGQIRDKSDKTLKLPKELSREVKRLHSGLGEELQFKNNEKFSSVHNMAVTATITQAIRDQQAFDPEEIHKACSRYFEHLKRDQKLIEDDKIKADRRAKALNNRRHRLLSQRKEVAREFLNPEELTYLEGAVASLMSDEETDEEDTRFWKVRPPSWRADKLSQILQRCQGALEEKVKDSPRMAHRRVNSGEASLRERPKAVNNVYLN